MILLALAEFIGTLVLIALGNGISQVLSIRRFPVHKTMNWLTIFFGWGLAIITAVTISGYISPNLGASLNPAVAIYQLFKEGREVALSTATAYFAIRCFFSLLGAIVGQLIIDLLHLKELQELEGEVVLSTHSTVPNDSSRWVRNLLNEVIATSIFVLAVVGTSLYPSGTGTIAVGLIGAIVIAVFGPSTGAAINPSRDLGPRIVYQLLPLTPAKERDAMWSYSYIPIVAPLLGGALVGIFDLLLTA